MGEKGSKQKKKHRRSRPFRFDSGMSAANIERRRTTRNGAVVFSMAVFATVFVFMTLLFWIFSGRVGLMALVLSCFGGILASNSIHVVLEWERAVVMRFGRFSRVAGPGIVFTIPIVEFYTVRIDQRVASVYFGAEETLTKDLVPVNVDAVLFWMVFDPEKAATEVEDYVMAVSWVAQTTMREAIGRISVAELATRREQLDDELKDRIEQKLSPWGIDIIDVEVRDIVIPKELQKAMAAEAVAERRRNARIVLAEAEQDISAMLADASESYDTDDAAMRLRTMHLACEGMEDAGGTLILPSNFADGFVGEAPRK